MSRFLRDRTGRSITISPTFGAPRLTPTQGLVGGVGLDRRPAVEQRTGGPLGCELRGHQRFLHVAAQTPHRGETTAELKKGFSNGKIKPRETLCARPQGNSRFCIACMHAAMGWSCWSVGVGAQKLSKAKKQSGSICANHVHEGGQVSHLGYFGLRCGYVSWGRFSRCTIFCAGGVVEALDARRRQQHT